MFERRNIAFAVIPLTREQLHKRVDRAAPVLFLPGLLLSLGGGAIFGAALGCLVVWAGAVLGETLAFLFGRCALCLLAGFPVAVLRPFHTALTLRWSFCYPVLQAAAAGLAEDADKQVPSLGGMLPSILLGPLQLPMALERLAEALQSARCCDHAVHLVARLPWSSCEGRVCLHRR